MVAICLNYFSQGGSWFLWLEMLKAQTREEGEETGDPAGPWEGPGALNSAGEQGKEPRELPGSQRIQSDPEVLASGCWALPTAWPVPTGRCGEEGAAVWNPGPGLRGRACRVGA